MAKNILIAGGSGKIGRKLTERLKEEGHTISWLTSSNQSYKDIKAFQWDYTTGKFDSKALENIDAIINLAGAGIADQKWTRERKKILKDSRVKTTELLLEKVKENNVQLDSYISSSAIGYYGYDSGSIEKKEGSRFGDDFLATLTKDWEGAADGFSKSGIRTVILRTGIVLGKEMSAWERVAKVTKTGFGAALGSGDQYMSWIHIDDLVNMYKWALDNNEIEGIYNAVAPNPVSNKDFTRAAAKALKKPLFLPNVPGFVLKLLYGEIASVLIGSSRVSSAKAVEDGFEFTWTNIEEALQGIA